MDKNIRRIIIFVAILLLLPNIIASSSTLFSFTMPKELKREIEAGEASNNNIDQEVELGSDTITFENLVVSENKTTLIYQIKNNEQGWSFPDSALQLKTQNGSKIEFNGASASHRGKRSFTVAYYEAIPEDNGTVTIDFEWYDRSFQVDIPLKKGGTVE